MSAITVRPNPFEDPIEVPASFVEALREGLGDVSDFAIVEAIEDRLRSGDLDVERFRRFCSCPLNREYE